MATLSEKKEALHILEGCHPEGVSGIAREALRREIAREEEEERGKLPTLWELIEANSREDLSSDHLARIGRILEAVEKLAPLFKNYVGLNGGPLNEFANAIAAEVRLT